MNLQKLDNLLDMLVERMTEDTEQAIKNNENISKNHVEAACTILSVAYERVRSIGK